MAAISPTIAIIGAGNMGSALIRGLLKQHYPANQLWACDPSAEKRHFLQNKLAISVTPSNEEAAQQAEALIFAVKPQTLETVATNLAPLIQKKKPLIISIVTGIREERLQDWLGGQVPIVRAMPNTPALIGCGATALYANRFTSPNQTKLADHLLRTVGTTIWLEDEKQMDAVTALSGSGPAYFFLLIEALQEAGCSLGLAEETARQLSLQTAYGASRLALESEETVAQLRQRVTSPQGTTERALGVLDQGDFRLLILKAVQAAKQRAEELAAS